MEYLVKTPAKSKEVFDLKSDLRLLIAKRVAGINEKKPDTLLKEFLTALKEGEEKMRNQGVESNPDVASDRL